MKRTSYSDSAIVATYQMTHIAYNYFQQNPMNKYVVARSPTFFYRLAQKK